MPSASPELPRRVDNPSEFVGLSLEDFSPADRSQAVEFGVELIGLCRGIGDRDTLIHIAAALIKNSGTALEIFFEQLSGRNILPRPANPLALTALYELGTAHHIHAKAPELCRQALELNLELAREIDDQCQICATSLELGLCWYRADRYAEATELLSSGLNSYAQLFGHAPQGELVYRNILAQAAAQSNNFDLSKESAEWLYDKINSTRNRTEIETYRYELIEAGLIAGEIFLERARFNEAQKAYEKALELTAGNADDLFTSRARALCGIGETYARQGDNASAVTYFERARKLLTTHGDDRSAIYTDVLQELASSLGALGRFEEKEAAEREFQDAQKRWMIDDLNSGGTLPAPED